MLFSIIIFLRDKVKNIYGIDNFNDIVYEKKFKSLENIIFKDVYYKYPEKDNYTLRKVNLEIKKDTNVIAVIFTSEANLFEEELRKHIEERLADYKKPRVYIKVNTIPTVNNGKISRKKLSETYKGMTVDCA